MINELTGLDNAYWSKQSLAMDSIKTDFNTSKPKDETFRKMLSDNIGRDGKVKVEKLDAQGKKLYDSCLEMESLLWKQVLNAMKKTVDKNQLIDGGNAEDIFSDFLYDEYSMMMSKHSGTNIADTIFKQLSGYGVYNS